MKIYTHIIHRLIILLFLSMICSVSAHAQTFSAPVEADFDSPKEFSDYLLGTPAEIQNLFTTETAPGSLDEFLTTIELAMPTYQVPWGDDGKLITIAQYRDQTDAEIDYSTQTPTYTPAKFHKMTYSTSNQALTNLRTQLARFVTPTEKYLEELAYTTLAFTKKSWNKTSHSYEESSDGIVAYKESTAIHIFAADLFAIYVQEFTAVSAEAAKAAVHQALKAYVKLDDEKLNAFTDLASTHFQNYLEMIYKTQSRLRPDLSEDELAEYQARIALINSLRANYESAIRSSQHIPLSLLPFQQISPITAVYVRDLFAIADHALSFQGGNTLTAGLALFGDNENDIKDGLINNYKDVQLLGTYVDACTNASGVMSLIMIFKEPADHQYLYDKLLGIQETLVNATYETLPGVLDYVQYLADLNNGRPTKQTQQAALVDDPATWIFANELAVARLSNERVATAVNIAVTGGSIVAAVASGIASGGNPWVAAGVGMAIAGATGAYDVYSLQQMDRVAHGAFSAKQFAGLPLSSDALINYYDQAVDYAIKSTAANIALAGISGGTGTATEVIKIPGHAGWTILIKSIAEAEIGAADGLLSALADGRISNQQFVDQEYELAGGEKGNAPTVVKGIIYSVGMSAIAGGAAEGGFGTLGHGFQIVIDANNVTKILRSDGLDVTNQSINIHVNLDDNALDGKRVVAFWPDGKPVTDKELAAFNESIKELSAFNESVAKSSAPVGTGEIGDASTAAQASKTPPQETPPATATSTSTTPPVKPVVSLTASEVRGDEPIKTLWDTRTVDHWADDINESEQFGSMWYSVMTPEQQAKVATRLRPERLDQILEKITLRQVTDKFRTSLGNGVDTNLKQRANVQPLKLLESQMMLLGRRNLISASGVEQGKGGLVNLAGIISDGKLREGSFIAGLTKGDSSYSAGQHGPYYVIVKESRGGLSAANVAAYVVPENVDRQFLISTLTDPALQPWMDPAIISDGLAKIKTYAEFVAGFDLPPNELAMPTGICDVFTEFNANSRDVDLIGNSGKPSYDGVSVPAVAKANRRNGQPILIGGTSAKVTRAGIPKILQPNEEWILADGDLIQLGQDKPFIFIDPLGKTPIAVKTTDGTSVAGQAGPNLDNPSKAANSVSVPVIPSRTFGTIYEAKAAARISATIEQIEYSIMQEADGTYIIFAGTKNTAGTGALGDASSSAENGFFKVKFVGHVQPKGLNAIPSKADFEIIAREALELGTQTHTVLGYVGDIEVETVIQAINVRGTVSVTAKTNPNILPLGQWQLMTQRLESINSDLINGRLDSIQTTKPAEGEVLNSAQEPSGASGSRDKDPVASTGPPANAAANEAAALQKILLSEDALPGTYNPGNLSANDLAHYNKFIQDNEEEIGHVIRRHILLTEDRAGNDASEFLAELSSNAPGRSVRNADIKPIEPKQIINSGLLIYDTLFSALNRQVGVKYEMSVSPDGIPYYVFYKTYPSLIGKQVDKKNGKVTALNTLKILFTFSQSSQDNGQLRSDWNLVTALPVEKASGRAQDLPAEQDNLALITNYKNKLNPAGLTHYEQTISNVNGLMQNSKNDMQKAEIGKLAQTLNANLKTLSDMRPLDEDKIINLANLIDRGRTDPRFTETSVSIDAASVAVTVGNQTINRRIDSNRSDVYQVFIDGVAFECSEVKLAVNAGNVNGVPTSWIRFFYSPDTGVKFAYPVSGPNEPHVNL